MEKPFQRSHTHENAKKMSATREKQMIAKKRDDEKTGNMAMCKHK